MNPIEHWTKIGRIAEENPDLPYNFIKDILISMEEMKTEKPVPYENLTLLALGSHENLYRDLKR